MSKQRRLYDLIRDGADTAGGRGHKMGEFAVGRDETRGFATCRDCGCGVLATTRPAPNETELMGGALALECQYACAPAPDVGC